MFIQHLMPSTDHVLYKKWKHVEKMPASMYMQQMWLLISEPEFENVFKNLESVIIDHLDWEAALNGFDVCNL